MASKYQLYYSPGACSMAVHVILHELCQPVDLVKVNLSEARDENFLRLSPRGQVPVLVEDSVPIIEGAAIIIHLCEKFKSKLLPSEGLARAKALEALMFCNATLHPACGRVFKAMRMQAEPQVKDLVFNSAFTDMQKLWDAVEKHLEHTAYMAGEEITAADILLTVIANWSYSDKRPSFGPNTKRLIAEISQRPAYQKAMAEEGIEYKAAA